MLMCLFRLIAAILPSKTMTEPQVRCGAPRVFWTQAGEVGGYQLPLGGGKRWLKPKSLKQENEHCQRRTGKERASLALLPQRQKAGPPALPLHGRLRQTLRQLLSCIRALRKLVSGSVEAGEY
ncbi:hypothetical protein V8C34DRAFT_139215 [Trichoderma compactum]